MNSRYEQAKAAEDAERLYEALELWGEAVQESPFPAALCRLGLTAQALGYRKLSEAAFLEALRMDVSSNEAMEGLGLLAFSRSDIDETDGLQQAESWFLRALKFSRTARVLTFLGATYKALDKKAEAIHFCEEAIQEDCKYEEALFNLATLEEGSVQTRAIELFERAIQIDPDYGAAHERLEGTLQKRNDFTEAEYHFQTLDWN